MYLIPHSQHASSWHEVWGGAAMLLAGIPRANSGNLRHRAATRFSHLLDVLTLTNWLFLFLFPQEVNFPHNCDSRNSSHCCGNRHLLTLSQNSCCRSKLPGPECATRTSLTMSRAIICSQHCLYWSRMASTPRWAIPKLLWSHADKNLSIHVFLPINILRYSNNYTSYASFMRYL